MFEYFAHSLSRVWSQRAMFASAYGPLRSRHVGGVVGAEGDDPAATKSAAGDGPHRVVPVDLAGQDLDDGAGTRYVGHHRANPDVLVLGGDPFPRLRQVVGRDEAVRGGVADVRDRAARGAE